jgi:hypothetical protein
MEFKLGPIIIIALSIYCIYLKIRLVTREALINAADHDFCRKCSQEQIKRRGTRW